MILRISKWIVFFSSVVMTLVAREIPVKDLTQEETRLSSGLSSVIPRALAVKKESSAGISQTTKLELVMREVQALKKAAIAAGGDLEISMRLTGGIRAEDLVVPLSKMGVFEIKPGKSEGSIRVESKPKPSESVEVADKMLSTVHLKPQVKQEIPTLVLP